MPTAGSTNGACQPRWVKASLGSSSGPPGACVTPSRVRNVCTVSFICRNLAVPADVLCPDPRFWSRSCIRLARDQLGLRRAQWNTSRMDNWGAPLYGEPCRECAFSWSAGLAATVSLMRGIPDSIDELVKDATGTERLPHLGWNVSGYVAHMTDNTRIWSERLVAVARGADAHVVPYDPDLLAESRRYNEVALQGARWSLRIAVDSWLNAVTEADPAEVVMLHSERGAMELHDVVASNTHDAVHHCWDVTQILRGQ